MTKTTDDIDYMPDPYTGGHWSEELSEKCRAEYEATKGDDFHNSLIINPDYIYHNYENYGDMLMVGYYAAVTSLGLSTLSFECINGEMYHVQSKYGESNILDNDTQQEVASLSNAVERAESAMDVQPVEEGVVEPTKGRATGVAM